MNYAYLLATAFMLLCGWRAWTMLSQAQPFARAAGALFSAIAPFPIFLLIVLYHYAAQRKPAAAGSVGSA